MSERPRSCWRTPRQAAMGRRCVRHRLVSAVARRHPVSGLLEGVVEQDVVVYVAATHLGKVRLRVGSVAVEFGHDPPRIMGVLDGDGVPQLAVWDVAAVAP